MIQKVYSEQIAKKIIDIFHGKGWNLYRKDTKKSADERIIENLVDKLEVNVSYDLLPAANNPNDPKQVFDALEVLAQKLNREMPTIKVGYESHPLTGITLKEKEVKIHIPEGTHVSYPEFMDAINSVINTN